MQTVLSIDVSQDVAEAIVANIDGKKIDIIEEHQTKITPIVATTTPAPSATESSPSAQSIDETNAAPQATALAISELLAKVTAPWTSAILVIPSQDYITLNMEMPFSDSKSINRIIDLEVQDLVPFEVEDFILTHKLIGPIANGEIDNKFDVHVGVMSKTVVRDILQQCKSASFEPLIVTTPSSALGALYSLAPDYFADNSAIILERMPYLYLLTFIDGQIRTERTIKQNNLDQTSDQDNSGRDEMKIKSLLTDLKLSLASAEQRYAKNFGRIYYIGKSIKQADLQSHLGRNVESVSIKEIVPIQSEQAGVAALAAIYAEDSYAPKVFCNLRTREFAYSPQLKELYRGLKALAPYLLSLAAVLMVFYAARYLVNEMYISRLNSAMHSQIARVIPAIENQSGDDLLALQAQNQQLEDQLKDISSISSMTPLDLFKEISADLPSSLGITINSVRIKDNKITVEGSAKNYADVDKVEKILQRKPLYKTVKKGESSAASSVSGNRSFSFELWVGE